METAVEDPQKDGAENAPSENASVEKATLPPAPEPSKKSKREDRNKKNDNYVEQFMKAVNSASTVEDKVNVACQKFSHMVDDNKRMQFYIKQSEKRHMLLLKEKEQLQHEFNKTVLVKSKLENLCRELQKQNKAIKEESLHKIREEEERRKETQAKFQNTLSEITTLLQQNNEKNAKLRDDNISMTEKFKSVVQQYQLREQQVDKMAKQMALEQQLSDAKLQKASLEHQAEKERLLAEMEQLKVTVAQFRAKIVELQGTETGLRGQLAVYTDKYDEFQSALVKSNQVFGGFKEEMEKMSKKIKKLEKESLSWKKRWETSQTALLEMCGERQANDDKMAAATRQLAHMQSLCRTLQAERTVLLSTLKEHDIERPPLPTPPPAPAPAPAPPAPASNAKVDAMAANCAQLRQSLAHLQSQLNVLTNKQAEGQQQPPKPEKPKKSKSKKSKKQEPKESESDTKESASENEPNVLVDKEAVDVGDVKADEKTLDTSMQAINNANINLSDLEDGTDKIEDVLNTDPTKETATNDVTAFDDVAAAPDVTAANDVTAAADVTVANDVIAPSDVTNLVKDVTNLALSDVTEVPKENVQVIDNKEAIPLKNEVVPAIENEPKVKADKVEIAKTETKEEKEITNNEIKNVDAQVNGA